MVRYPRRKLQVLLLLIAIAGVSFAVYWHLDAYFGMREETIGKTFEMAHAEVERAAQGINSRLEAAETVAAAIAEEIEIGAIEEADLPDRLARALNDLERLAAVTVAFEPERRGFGEPGRVISIVRGNDGLPVPSVSGSKEDFTDFSVRWYRDAVFNGALWTEPQRHAGTGQIMLRYARPFDKADDSGRIGGVVSVSYPVSLARSLVNGLGLGSSGYAWIVSREGRFLLHPHQELVKSGRTLFQVAWEHDDIALYALAARAVSGEAGWQDWVNEVTGQQAWVFHQPIESADWSLIVVHEVRGMLNPDEQRRRLIDVNLLAALALFLVIWLVITLLVSGEWKIWALVAGYAPMVAATIGGIWYIADRYPVPLKIAALEIYNESALHRFLSAHEKESLTTGSPAAYVPTGVFIQSIEFASGSNVEVTGYVWQDYRRRTHRGLSRGFVMPEAVDPKISVAYHHPEQQCPPLDEAATNGESRDCDEVVGWYFSTLLRQSFDYSKYPFDRQEVWLRLWHMDFESNTVLVPDLASYETTNPLGKPGVEKDFVLPGWAVTGSNFDYRLTSYNTNFGLENYVGQEDFPELYFNVLIKRNFLGAFVSKIIPLLVVAIMLFAILLIGSKQDDKAGWYGFSAKDVVLGASALFFVVIFDHASLRNALGSSRVMYLEYFYFALYLAIMFVSVNAILFASTMRIPPVDWRDNLLPKLAFWPLYMTSMLIVTVLVFR